MCPKCGERGAEVSDTRIDVTGKNVRRRRQCYACGKLWRTIEIPAQEYKFLITANKKLDAIKSQFILLLENWPVFAAPETQFLSFERQDEIEDAE
jgi:transcriptional regulator NrdR family protein